MPNTQKTGWTCIRKGILYLVSLLFSKDNSNSSCSRRAYKQLFLKKRSPKFMKEPLTIKHYNSSVPLHRQVREVCRLPQLAESPLPSFFSLTFLWESFWHRLDTDGIIVIIPCVQFLQWFFFFGQKKRCNQSLKHLEHHLINEIFQLHAITNLQIHNSWILKIWI